MPENIRKITSYLRIYHVALGLIYLLMAVGMTALAIFGLNSPEAQSDPDSKIAVVILFGVAFLGIVFVILHIFAYVIVRKPTKFNWILQLIIICIGLTSCATLPFCIYFIIQWMKDDVKGYYMSGVN